MSDLPSQTHSLLPAASPEAVVLALEDLLPDPGGEIVIRSTGMDTIGVVTDRSITETGTSEAHVTAAGEDVAGFHFYRLDGGMTLYCPADTRLILGPDLV